MDAVDRADARYAAPGANDHLAVDRLADQTVRAADVVLALRRDRRGLDPVAGVRHRVSRLGADGVARPAAVLEREIETLELDVEADHFGGDEAQRLLEQLQPGLVALQHR